MNIRQGLINELKHEAANTTKMLERLSSDHFDFKPHDKSFTLGRLAGHIADLSGWIPMIFNSTEVDLATSPFKRDPITSTEEVVQRHKENVAAAIGALEKATDEDMAAAWTLRRGDYIIASMPRAAIIRSLSMNHMIHHRGQLSVYMRINDVPLPGIYGPSADEQ